mgnify:FL=1
MAAGFRGGDQIIEAELEWGFAQAVGKVLELFGCSIELEHQGAQKGWILSNDRLLFAPTATAGGIGELSFLALIHGLEAVQAVGQQTQVVAVHLREKAGVDPGDRLSIHALPHQVE